MKKWMRALREWFESLKTVKTVRRWIWIGKLKGDMKTVREILATGEDPLHGIGFGYVTHPETYIFQKPWRNGNQPTGYLCPDTRPEGETVEPREIPKMVPDEREP